MTWFETFLALMTSFSLYMMILLIFYNNNNNKIMSNYRWVWSFPGNQTIIVLIFFPVVGWFIESGFGFRLLAFFGPFFFLFCLVPLSSTRWFLFLFLCNINVPGNITHDLQLQMRNTWRFQRYGQITHSSCNIHHSSSSFPKPVYRTRASCEVCSNAIEYRAQQIMRLFSSSKYLPTFFWWFYSNKPQRVENN